MSGSGTVYVRKKRTFWTQFLYTKSDKLQTIIRLVRVIYHFEAGADLGGVRTPPFRIRHAADPKESTFSRPTLNIF